MNRKIFALATCVSVASLTGCALTTDRVDIQYSPQMGVEQVPGAQNVVVNVKVVDQRRDTSKVSSKKNGFGMEMAPIVANEDVAVTIRRAIEEELKARGFKLGADAATVKIAADLTRFYNDFKIGFFAGDAVADLNMVVSVRSAQGNMLYSRHVSAQGVEPNIQLALGHNAQAALNKALESGIKMLFEDQAFLEALVKSSPQ